MPDYDSLLFDNDGVLLDVTTVGKRRYFAAIERAFEAFDASPDPADLQAFLGEEDLDEIATRCERLGVPFEALWTRKERHLVRLQRRLMDRGTLALYDDAAVLHSLAGEYALGIASNTQQGTLDHMLERFDLSDRFEVAVGRDPTPESARRRKPAPDFIEAALAELPDGDVLYVGDSTVDVEVADRVGLDVAFVRRDGPATVPDGRATYVVESLHELESLLDG